MISFLRSLLKNIFNLIPYIITFFSGKVIEKNKSLNERIENIENSSKKREEMRRNADRLRKLYYDKLRKSKDTKTNKH